MQMDNDKAMSSKEQGGRLFCTAQKGGFVPGLSVETRAVI